MKKLLLLAVIPVWVGCSSPAKDKAPASAPSSASAPAKEEPPAQRKLCLAGLSGLRPETPPEARAMAVVTACFPGCRPKDLKEAADIERWGKGALEAPEIIAACDAFCSPEAAASKTRDGGTDWREVARVCGGEYFRLPVGQESLLTDEWAAIAKISDYIGLSMRTSSDEPALLASAKEALLHYWIPMPIPVAIEGQYTLPAAQQSAPIRARLSLRVNKGRGFLGALPILKITEEGAEAIDIPGLSWPNDVTFDAMEARVSEGMATIKQSLGEPASAPASSTSAPSMMKTAEVDDPEVELLYIADRDLPVTWFIQVMKAIPRRSLRVAVSVEGKALQHKARLEAPYENSNTAPTTITFTGDACLIQGVSPLPPASLPAQGATCDAEALKAEITKAKISGDRLSLILSPAMTMSQFVTILDSVSQLTSLTIWVSLEAPASQPASAPSQP